METGIQVEPENFRKETDIEKKYREDNEKLSLIINFMIDKKNWVRDINASIILGKNYLNSWEYLMEVVEKIKEDILIDVVISRNKCVIADVNVLNNLISASKSYYFEVYSSEGGTLYATLTAVLHYINHVNKAR